MAQIQIDGSYEPDPYAGYEPPPAPTQEVRSPGFMVPNENTGISGYGRPNGVEMSSPFQVNTAQPYSFNQGAFENAFRQQTSGKSGTLQEWQQSIFPALQQMFPDIQSFGSKGDKIRLPNGQVIDAVISAGAGGRGYGLNYDNPLGGYFSDPLLQGYLNFGQDAIGRLMGPQGVNPVLQQAIDSLTQMINGGTPHLDAGFMYPLQEAIQKRQAQLDQPGFSNQQMDLMRTQFTDPLEAQRSAAKQQVMQRLAQRGIQPGSGIMEQALQDVDRSFSQMRTSGERDFGEKQIAMDEARKQEAVQLAQFMGQLGFNASQADLQGQLSGKNSMLSALSQLAGIGGNLQNEPIRNLMSAMGIYGDMAQLPFQANTNAINSMNAINGQSVPQYESMLPIIQTLLGLANQGEGVYNDTQQSGNNFWNILGGALPDLINSFSGLFGGGNTPKAPPNGQY